MSDLLGISLFIVSVILRIILCPFFYIYGFIKSAKAKRLGDYHKQIGLAFDRVGNVMGQYALNDILIEADGYRAGNGKETISSFLGKNEIKQTLTGTGKVVAGRLDAIQHNHCINAIDNNID